VGAGGEGSVGAGGEFASVGAVTIKGAEGGAVDFDFGFAAVSHEVGVDFYAGAFKAGGEGGAFFARAIKGARVPRASRAVGIVVEEARGAGVDVEVVGFGFGEAVIGLDFPIGVVLDAPCEGGGVGGGVGDEVRAGGFQVDVIEGIGGGGGWGGGGGGGGGLDYEGDGAVGHRDGVFAGGVNALGSEGHGHRDVEAVTGAPFAGDF